MKLAEDQPIFCPLLKKDCIGKKCMWFVKLAGVDSTTGAEVDEYFCAPVAQTLLLAENSQQTRQAGAAMEGLRNQVNEGNLIMSTAVRLRALEMKNGGQ